MEGHGCFCVCQCVGCSALREAITKCECATCQLLGYVHQIRFLHAFFPIRLPPNLLYLLFLCYVKIYRAHVPKWTFRALLLHPLHMPNMLRCEDGSKRMWMPRMSCVHESSASRECIVWIVTSIYCPRFIHSKSIHFLLPWQWQFLTNKAI